MSFEGVPTPTTRIATLSGVQDRSPSITVGEYYNGAEAVRIGETIVRTGKSIFEAIAIVDKGREVPAIAKVYPAGTVRCDTEVGTLQRILRELDLHCVSLKPEEVERRKGHFPTVYARGHTGDERDCLVMEKLDGKAVYDIVSDFFAREDYIGGEAYLAKAIVEYVDYVHELRWAGVGVIDRKHTDFRQRADGRFFVLDYDVGIFEVSEMGSGVGHELSILTDLFQAAGITTNAIWRPPIIADGTDRDLDIKIFDPSIADSQSPDWNRLSAGMRRLITMIVNYGSKVTSHTHHETISKDGLFIERTILEQIRDAGLRHRYLATAPINELLSASDASLLGQLTPDQRLAYIDMICRRVPQDQVPPALLRMRDELRAGQEGKYQEEVDAFRARMQPMYDKDTLHWREAEILGTPRPLQTFYHAIGSNIQQARSALPTEPIQNNSSAENERLWLSVLLETPTIDTLNQVDRLIIARQIRNIVSDSNLDDTIANLTHMFDGRPEIRAKFAWILRATQCMKIGQLMEASTEGVNYNLVELPDQENIRLFNRLVTLGLVRATAVEMVAGVVPAPDAITIQQPNLPTPDNAISNEPGRVQERATFVLELLGEIETVLGQEKILPELYKLARAAYTDLTLLQKLIQIEQNTQLKIDIDTLRIEVGLLEALSDEMEMSYDALLDTTALETPSSEEPPSQSVVSGEFGPIEGTDARRKALVWLSEIKYLNKQTKRILQEFGD